MWGRKGRPQRKAVITSSLMVNGVVGDRYLGKKQQPGEGRGDVIDRFCFGEIDEHTIMGCHTTEGQ